VVFAYLDLDECESDPCANGGECHNGHNAYNCTCMPGYSGNNCQTDIDECASSPCRNNGTCKDLVGRYRCSCVRGFTGRNCETEIEICDSSPCKNGGNCSQNAGKYQCKCTPGYTGLNCDEDYDECSSHPCQNGGTCSTPDFNMFSCQCAPGYSGTSCETGSNCTAKPCENGGACVETNNTRTCKCLAGYTGENCETDIDDCQSTPCQNGGSCQDYVNAYTCSCTSLYYGTSCQQRIAVSDIARVDLNVKLETQSYSENLKNKNSTEYQLLKTKVVDALENILDDKLGKGRYKILDVAFSKGSVVVKYMLEMMKAAATSTVTNVRNAIAKKSGTFAGFSVDVNSVKASVKTIVRYYGQFRVPDLHFEKKWSDINLPEYIILAREVQMKLEIAYNRETGSSLVYVEDIRFTKGSVIVDFSLGVDDVTNNDLLKKIFSRNPFMIGNKTVDPNSFVFSENVLGGSGLSWFPVVLGSTISLGLLILVVILVVFVVKTCRRNRRRASPGNHVTNCIPHSSKRRNVWKEHSPTPPPLVDPTVAVRYEQQRMEVLNTAIQGMGNIRWTLARRFAQRYVPRRADLVEEQPPEATARSQYERHAYLDLE
ncbi:hypothetical protein LSAT2_016581, partial [Lamellibrachia satsuma]